MKSGHFGQKADTLQKVSACSRRPAMRSADRADRADTFGRPLYVRARFKNIHVQVSVVSVVSAFGFLCGSERADTFFKVSASGLKVSAGCAR